MIHFKIFLNTPKDETYVYKKNLNDDFIKIIYQLIKTIIIHWKINVNIKI